MSRFTRKAVRVALIQAAIIVAGVLAANFGYHMAKGRIGFAPDSTAFLAHFGFLLLGLPLAWFRVTVRLRQNAASARWQKLLAMGSGLALVACLTLFSAYAVGKPWIRSTEWLQTG